MYFSVKKRPNLKIHFHKKFFNFEAFVITIYKRFTKFVFKIPLEKTSSVAFIKSRSLLCKRLDRFFRLILRPCFSIHCTQKRAAFNVPIVIQQTDASAFTGIRNLFKTQKVCIAQIQSKVSSPYVLNAYFATDGHLLKKERRGVVFSKSVWKRGP